MVGEFSEALWFFYKGRRGICLSPRLEQESEAAKWLLIGLECVWAGDGMVVVGKVDVFLDGALRGYMVI